MKKILILIFLMSLTPNLWAQHNHHGRSGLYFGIGLGLNSTESSLRSSNNDFVLDEGSGLATSLRLGVGLGDHLRVYYIHDNSWYADFYQGDTKMTGIRGVGMSYYLDHSFQTVYFMGALGTGVVEYPFVADAYFEGAAAMLGVGLSLNDRVSLEANILGTSIPDDIPGETIDHFSSRVMLNMELF